MIKILRESTGKLIKEFEYEDQPHFLCDINEHEYILMLLRDSVIGVEDVRDEYMVLIQIINTMFNEGYSQEEMNNEFGNEFVEYRNKIFNETFEFLKDKTGNVGLKAGVIFLKNKIQ